MIKKILTITVLIILLASCVTVPIERSITLTVGSYNSYKHMGDYGLEVSIEKSNTDQKEAEKETNEVLDAVSTYLDEKGLSYSLRSSSAYKNRNPDIEMSLFTSSKSLSVLINEEMDSTELIRELEALGATGIFNRNNFPVNSFVTEEAENFQGLMDQAISEAGKIADIIGCKLGKVLTVKHFQDSEIYEISFKISE